VLNIIIHILICLIVFIISIIIIWLILVKIVSFIDEKWSTEYRYDLIGTKYQTKMKIKRKFRRKMKNKYMANISFTGYDINGKQYIGFTKYKVPKKIKTTRQLWNLTQDLVIDSRVKEVTIMYMEITITNIIYFKLHREERNDELYGEKL